VKEKTLEGPEDRLLKAKSDALRLIAHAPRSVQELRTRLKQKKYGDELIDEVIEAFKKQGLLDDEKFAKLFAQSRVHTRPSGRRQLEFDMRRKGLSRETIGKAIEDLGEVDEKKTARDLVAGRFAKMTGVSDEKKKSRLFGFLKRRGFASQTIYAVLNELFRDMEEDA
jgi:regulatory protein